MWPFNRPKPDNYGRAGAGLIKLPAYVDDNLYLASASKAAFADKQSGAYDQFLFSDDAHVKMPFEYTLETHTELVSSRLEDQGRRDVGLRHRAILVCLARIARLTKQLDQLKDRLKINQEDLLRQERILNGQEKGDQEMYWTDSIPHVASTLSARFRLWSHGLTFLVVSAIDFQILKLSIQSLPGFNVGYEALVLTLPALGIQVIFPHLLGERRAYMLRGHPKVKQNRREAFALAIGWLTFVLVITAIRFFYITQQGGNTIAGQEQMSKLQPIITLLSLLMLLGLGTWMILLASRRNPHKDEYLHLLLAKQKITKRISKAEIDLLSGQGELPPLELSLKVAQESYREAVKVTREELTESARTIYKRSLINSMADVDFTTAYLKVNDLRNPQKWETSIESHDLPTTPQKAEFDE